MGFRDFEGFNQDLLAKKAWRIVTNPNSLCSRVLKARYFKDGNFLEARCPKRASYTWKSILHGRELLKEGLVWQIGDGKKVNVWTDKGIPRSSAHHLLGHRPDVVVEKVSELLLPEGVGWDVDKLNNLFSQADVEDIKKIHVGQAGTVDYLAWNYTKNWNFSVKSAYHLRNQVIKAKEGAPASSNLCDEHKGWLALWAAEVPGKTNIHVWRLARNGLAVGDELN
jgi:hypothetical protein